MKLRPRLLISALAVALPLAIALYAVNEHLHARNQRLILERAVTSLLTDDTRERCESNPNWFLAGPRPDRPRPEVLAAPDADVTAPRPPMQALPFEYFAYDEAFAAMSSAAPRFPNDLRMELRRGNKTVTSEFATPEGAGWQTAVMTGWDRSPCTVMLFRLRPIARPWYERSGMFLALFVAMFAAALAAGGPLVARVRRLGLEARQSASAEYQSTISVGGRDELSAVAFAFNEAAADIRRRATDVRDREDSLRRYIANTGETVSTPLLALEQKLGQINPSGHVPAIASALADAHTLSMRVQNLSVAATLRMSLESTARDRIDLNALVDRVITRHAEFARAQRVSIQPSIATTPLIVTGDERLVEQAVSNLIDNAIRHNRPGGQVLVTLDRTGDGRFSLRVADDGPGAPDETLARLNANRRFRGDEGKSGRPGELGLGLAIVREVSDRFGIRWAFRKNSKGWFEAELTGMPSGENWRVSTSEP